MPCPSGVRGHVIVGRGKSGGFIDVPCYPVRFWGWAIMIIEFVAASEELWFKAEQYLADSLHSACY